MRYDPWGLNDRLVLVTGASSGIGRASSVLLSRLGARIIAVGRNHQRLEETLRLLEGQRHAVKAFDLQDSESIPGFISSVVRDHGPLSGIVHSAGIHAFKPLRMAEPRDYDDLFRVNVLAAAMLIGAVSRRGLAEKSCSVVLVGSVMSLLGGAGASGYCVSKSALLGLVRSAAVELSPSGIRINAVLPGYVQTEMTSDFAAKLGEKQFTSLRQRHLLGFGRVEDVAFSIAFLVGETGRWITGCFLPVDGGYTAQ